MVFNNNLLLGAAGAAGGYTIDQSIRFNDNDSAHLSRTPASAGDKRTWTWSCWIKRANLGIEQELLFCGPTASNLFQTQFSADNTFYINDYNGSSQLLLITDRVFRDPSAWYHFMLVFDTTQAFSSDRFKLYVNGQRETSFSTETYPSLNYEGRINATTQHTIGEKWTNTSKYLDGYLAEIHFIDGTALDPSSFGETNSITGQWVPVEYTGSYGTNGFYITGADSADLGADDSGNGNDFTSSGLTSADQMLDTPTDNYCVLSPIDKSSAITTSDGNLVVRNASTNSWNHGRGTLFAPSGKWYYEWIPTVGSYALAGWMLNVSGNDYVEEESDVATTFYRGVGAAAHGFRIGSGATDSAVTNFSLNDVIMMAIDVDSMKMWVGINGTWYNSGNPATGANPVGTWTDAIGQSVAPWYGCFNGTTESFNFGQRPFEYTIPTGFNSWNTANLPDPTIADPSAYFQTTLYTGNGTAIGSGGNAVDQSGNSTFQPDFVWIKNRDAADNHMLYDAVRGATKDLHSNTTDAEATDTEGLSTFDTDGFTVGSNVAVNTNTENYVAWQWAADGTSGSSNTDGSITSTVSANTTSGFSIVSYVSNDTAGATVGHGLGVAPSVVIQKNRDSTDNWYVLHTSLSGAGYNLYLDLTNGEDSNTAWWNGTNPTSTVVTLGPGNGAGSGPNEPTGENRIMYCFAEVEGFSKFGSYTGNGSTDGAFIYTGFKPAFVMYKRTNTTESWEMADTTRLTYNPHNDILRANLSNAETDNIRLDILSNGFKARSSDTAINASGSTYIYMAFASSPFKTATAR